MNAESALLAIDSVSKAFGGVQALTDITFSLDAGAITGLIGPNGAGKTTLFNLITGVFPTDTGQIRFDDRIIDRRPVHERVQMGIARTFQNVELFESMTVLENILVGRHTRTRYGILASMIRPPGVRREEKKATEKAIDLLDFIGLGEYAHRQSSDLAFGWQRLLELGRALASRPRLLLLDEPAAGLNIVETLQLGTLIKKVRDQGITILLVEHDMSLTMDVSDRIIVLDQGKMIADGTPRAIQENEAVMKAYLGETRQNP